MTFMLLPFLVLWFCFKKIVGWSIRGAYWISLALLLCLGIVVFCPLTILLCVILPIYFVAYWTFRLVAMGCEFVRNEWEYSFIRSVLSVCFCEQSLACISVWCCTVVVVIILTVGLSVGLHKK